MTTKVVFFLAALLAVPAAQSSEHPIVGTQHTPAVSFEAGEGYAEAMISAPVSKHLGLSGAMYRAMHDSVGYFGAEALVKAKGFTLAPGAGVMFGQHEPAGPAARLRAEYRNKWLGAEMSAIRAFRETEHGRHDIYATGYAAVRLPCWENKRLEVGPTAERIGHREEKENAVGSRFAVPLPKVKHSYLVGKILTHGQYRVGLEFRPH